MFRIKKSKKIRMIGIIVIILVFCQVAEGKGKEEPTIAPTAGTDEASKALTVTMISNVTSHRDDGIITVLPGDTIAANFNITNSGSNTLRDLEVQLSVSKYGIIKDNFTSTKTLLEINESWITPTYIIETLSGIDGSYRPVDLVIVLDRSGSMVDEISAIAYGLVDVIEEISKLIPNVRVGLILFSSEDGTTPIDRPQDVFDLTEDVSEIADVLKATYTQGGYEPWGDALWVAMNNMNWRNDDTVKIVTLITDEPCDSGKIIGYGEAEEIDYDGPLLYELFENYSKNDIHLCTIAATGSDSLTIKQLKSAASVAHGTFINLNEGNYDTSDLAEIIGDLALNYANEFSLKIYLSVKYLDANDELVNENYTFVVLMDFLPPEITLNEVIAFDAQTDKKVVNIYIKAKDISGLKFVEVYYKFDTQAFWTVSNATRLDTETYYLKVPFEYYNQKFYYQVYAMDWLGNANITEITEVDLTEGNEPTDIYEGHRISFYLFEYQQVLIRFHGSERDTFGIIYLNSYDPEEISVVIDDKNTTNIEFFNTTAGYSFVLKANHIVYVYLLVKNTITGVNVYDLFPETLEFGSNITRTIKENNAYLFKVSNEGGHKEKSVLADAIGIITLLTLYNAENWTFVTSDFSEIVIPTGEYFVLIEYAYHFGEIYISYNYETVNVPHEHYYTAKGSFNVIYMILALMMIGVSVIMLRKR